MLTVREVAQKLKVHEQTVYRWIYQKKLEATKIDGIVRISEEQYSKFINSGKEAGSGSLDKL